MTSILLTVGKVLAGGRGLSSVLLKRAASVALDWDTRQKSRFEAVDSHGRALGVFLPRGTQLRGGDVLVAEDGSLLRVEATPQPLLVVRVATGGTAFDLLRAAYHLGNRHVALELRPDRLQLEADPVLAGMLRGMGLAVSEEVAPFEPEGGAYSAGAAAVHGHGHGRGPERGHAEHAHGGHDHDHDQPTRAHVRESNGGVTQQDEPAHVHGPGCGHGHGPTRL